MQTITIPRWAAIRAENALVDSFNSSVGKKIKHYTLGSKEQMDESSALSKAILVLDKAITEEK